MHNAGRVGTLKFSESGWIVDIQTRVIEVDVIEGIEGFGSELQQVMFKRHFEVFS